MSMSDGVKDDPTFLLPVLDCDLHHIYCFLSLLRAAGIGILDLTLCHEWISHWISK